VQLDDPGRGPLPLAETAKTMDQFLCCNCRRESVTPSPTPAPPMVSERRGMPDNSISNPARAKFAGVGIVFQGVRGEALVVQSLTPGGPAELSGRVEVGDVLFTINEAKVADMDDSEFLFPVESIRIGNICLLCCMLLHHRSNSPYTNYSHLALLKCCVFSCRRIGAFPPWTDRKQSDAWLSAWLESSDEYRTYSSMASSARPSCK
jgi:hypothetical protein